MGAGTSAGTAPLGGAFWSAAPLDYLRNLRGFSPDKPFHSLFIRRMIAGSENISAAEIYPGREIRPGTDDSAYQEILQRMPDLYASRLLKHLLSTPNFRGIQSDNYRVFRFFRPSLIANYNHDGLAAKFCGQRHRVLDMHGTIEREYGSPRMAELVNELREYHLPDKPDGVLMGIPESFLDSKLALRLLEVGRFCPDFIAIIGYTFARYGDGHDDRVSLAYFLERFKKFSGNIYVIDPEPEYIAELLADYLKSRSVLPIRARWNVLAHAFVKALSDPSTRRTLNYLHEQILDRHGSSVSFPLACY